MKNPTNIPSIPASRGYRKNRRMGSLLGSLDETGKTLRESLAVLVACVFSETVSTSQHDSFEQNHVPESR